jgi:hypothetical protein
MKPSLFARSLAPFLLIGSLALAGCGAAMSTQSEVEAPDVAAGPAVQGSAFGGHAPIAGEHIYLAQPSITGYGTPARSLLGVAQPGFTPVNPPGYTLTANVSDPGVPVGAQYVTTDANGGFNLTGAYACTVGQPVFIYAYSGNIGATSGSSTSTVSTSVTGITVTGGGNNGTNSTATYKFTVTPAETITSGATVTISGLTGHFSIINGTQVVLAAGLTTTTFEFTATNRYGNGQYIATANYGTGDFGTGGQASYTTTTTTTNPAATNNAIGQLATLGNCPSAGNLFTQGNGALSYIYLNEVSTIATAYTFKPFTLATNNTAWDIGSSGTTQALVGIANAANTAAQLYNIQGNTTQSSSGDGEGHLANYQTQAGGVPNEGNGVVPQATIDTLANILAACVDSTPTSGGGASATCQTLFANATDTGLSQGTKPTDTATAAINIARYPAGNWSSTADTPTSGYVTNLFNLPTGAVPYVPDLAAAPNDWTIAINYPAYPVAGATSTNSTLYRAESIAFDNVGQAWITAQGSAGVMPAINPPYPASVVRWDPLGVQNSYASKGYIYGYVSIDGGNNAWAGNADSTSGIEEFDTNGVLTATYGSGYNSAYTLIATDTGSNGSTSGIFFVANTSSTDPTNGCGHIFQPVCTDNYELFAYGPGGATVTGSPFTISPGAITAGNNVAHGAIDAAGDLWLTTEETPYQVARVSKTGASAFTPVQATYQPEFPSIDGAGNAWVAEQNDTAHILKITPAGDATAYYGGTGNTGAVMASTFGSAVDGNGDIWFANRSGDRGTVSGVAGTNSIFLINHTNNLAISPPTNYIPEAQYPANATTFTTMLNDSLNLAVDPSGNVWCTNYLGNAVVELVGAGSPTVTPLSVAAATGKIGQKP